MNDRLYRSRDDRVLAGVCGGIAEYFDADPSLVRILYALVAVLSGFFPLLILYIIMVIVVPEEPLPGTIPPGPGWGPGGSWGAGSAWGQPWTTPGTPPAGASAGPEGTPGAGTPEGGTATEGPGTGAGAAPGATAGTPGGTAGTPGWGPTAGGPGYVDWRAQRAAWRAQRREMRAAWRAQRHGYGNNTGAIVIGLLLVIIGAWFFVSEAVPSLNAGWFWPAILILGGVMLLAGSLRSGGPRQS